MSQSPRPGDQRPVKLDTLPSVAGNRTGGQAGSESVGAPAVLIIGFGYQMVDATHSARLRFEIVQQMMWVRRVRLSFTLLPFRGGVQTAQSHKHLVAQFGNIAIIVSPANTNVLTENFRDGTGAVSPLNVATFAPLNTSDLYTYDSPVINLNPPSSVFETGNARGTALTIDGTDYTAQLGGPWGVGAQLDVSDLDLSKIQVPGRKQSIWKRGFHEIDLSSSTIGGIQAQLLLVGTINAV